MMSFLPGWNSAATTARLHDIFEIAGIVFLALLVIAEVLAYIYGHQRDQLISEETRVADIAREAETARMRQQLVDAEKAATEAKQNATELQQLRVPRTLSDTQKAKLSTFLTNKPKGHFTIKASATADDARVYGDEIAMFFRDQLGWTVKVDNAIIMGPDISGMWITIKDGNSIPLITEILHSALTFAEFPIRHDVIADPGVTTQTEVWLSIGSKK